jgi:ferredoxin
VQKEEGNPKSKRAVVDETLCLGCGICFSYCKFSGLRMQPREKKVFTPETIFDRIVAMAIERGKLADTLFDEPEKLSHRALGRIVRTLEKTSMFKASMGIKPLKSVFLKTIVKGAKAISGEIVEKLDR